MRRFKKQEKRLKKGSVFFLSGGSCREGLLERQRRRRQVEGSSLGDSGDL